MFDANEGSGSVAQRAKPGELMRLVADRLTRNGFDVSLPEHDDGCRLTITGQDLRSTLSVSDCGLVQWEWCPRAADGVDPAKLADLTATLLTGQAGERPGDQREPAGLTLKGAVGVDLRARGLTVALNVCEDELYFDAETEIVVTSPGSDPAAEVRITDNGSFTWQRDYWPEAATSSWEPEFHWWITDAAKLADAITAKLTQAISQCLPAVRA